MSAADKVAAFITDRIEDGSWVDDDFPTMMEIKDTLRVSTDTVSKALQQLREAGVVHKVKRQRPVGERGRLVVWRPTSTPSQEPTDASEQLEVDIRSGRLAGQLPGPLAMAGRLRVHQSLVLAVYRKLQRAGVVDQVWLPDLTRRVWYRVAGLSADERRLLYPGDCKSLAIAHHLVRRMPEWLTCSPEGQWYRTALPQLDVLMEDYRAHFFVVKRSLELLVRLRILERPLGDPKFHMPLPPRDSGAAHGVTLNKINSRALTRDWYPVTTTVVWPPIPVSKSDQLFAGIEDQAATYRRNRTASSSQGSPDRHGPMPTTWRRGITAAREFHQHFGHLDDRYADPSRPVWEDPEFDLIQWLATMRAQHAWGRLAEEQIAELDSLGIVWNAGGPSTPRLGSRGAPRPIRRVASDSTSSTAGKSAPSID